MVEVHGADVIVDVSLLASVAVTTGGVATTPTLSLVVPTPPVVVTVAVSTTVLQPFWQVGHGP